MDGLLVSAAGMLKGRGRRMFLADVCYRLCDGSPRKTEERFGWGRQTVAKGLLELQQGESESVVESTAHRGRQRSEEANPQLTIDIRLIVEPRTHSDPELKTERQYMNLSAAEVRRALVEHGYLEDQLPSERTLRDILNRMNAAPSGVVQKETDAIFENVHAARNDYRDDPETIEISVDTKSKVSLGEYALGGKNQNG